MLEGRGEAQEIIEIWSPLQCLEEKYEKIKKIGEGSYARIWKAKRKADDQICVIKIIGNLTTCTEGEASVLKALSHPNIVRYFNSHLVVQNLYYVLETEFID